MTNRKMKNLNRKNNQRNSKKGQSLIEFMILSLALISLIKGILILFWIFISLIWIEHHLYQGLICSAQQKNINFCKNLSLQQIKKLNHLGVIKSLKLTHFKKHWKGEAQWHFYKQNFFIRQSLSLPH